MSQKAEASLELTKSAVEAVQGVMAFIESAEKLASACGVFRPLISLAAAIVKLALGKVDSPELTYMKEQFQIVRNKLDVISDQIKDVLWAVQENMRKHKEPVSEVHGHHLRGATQPILDTVMKCDQRNRRLMEQFCVRLKSLFCTGMIPWLAHAAITGNDAKALEKQWDEKLSKVDEKIKSMIDRCINEFAEQAKIDTERFVLNT
ncbi:protein rapunzel-like [Mobula birostris]|uniref:protein rapunzel-like n=1 Tax=Mobula birostris TaxID=1983395 RepID=UPI003B2868EB